MMQRGWVDYILFFGVIGLACLVALKLGHQYWSYRLRQWAASQGLKLIDFRGAKFYEGPSAWVRSDNQYLFHVEVEDKEGTRKSAWIMFGTYWGFTLRLPVTQVLWVDPPGSNLI